MAKKKSYDSLPTWREINTKKDNGEKLDPVEDFIFEYEEAGVGDIQFRAMFQEALYYFCGKQLPQLKGR